MNTDSQFECTTCHFTWWGCIGTNCPHCALAPAVPAVEAGKKYDAGKTEWHLFLWLAAGEVVRVLMFGAKKYGEFNWVKVERARERYFNAAIRHLTAWYRGERNDAESGLHHLAHAACCVLFLLEAELRGAS